MYFFLTFALFNGQQVNLTKDPSKVTNACELALLNLGRYSTLMKSLKTIMHLDLLTLKVLVTTIDAQWKGMGDVG